MTEYVKARAEGHSVTYEGCGNKHFFNVKSKSGEKHSVSVEVNCDCRYMSVQGRPNGQACSHVIAVLKHVVESGNIRLSHGNEKVLFLKKRAALNLVRPSNRVLNKVRSSEGEGREHREKKESICEQLRSEGKDFITEAIFDNHPGRADVFVLDDCKIIEIVKSESAESILEKREKYPEGVAIEVVVV